MRAFKTIQTGEVTGTTSAVQMPNVPCSYVKIKAQVANSGNVLIGGAATMTVPDGVGDSTTGYELDSGQEIEVWVENLNKLYLIASASGNHVTYIAFS